MCVSIWPPLTVYISVSPFDSMCINLTSVHLYISVSIWQCVYQTDLSWLCVYINFSIWPQLTVCLHLMVCVSNWPQLSMSPFDIVCINLTSVDCVYTFVYQCLHLTVCVSNWPQLNVCIYQCLHLTVCVLIWPQLTVCIHLTSVDCACVYPKTRLIISFGREMGA